MSEAKSQVKAERNDENEIDKKSKTKVIHYLYV